MSAVRSALSALSALIALSALSALSPSSAAAQTRLITVGAGGTMTRLVRSGSGPGGTLSGVSFGGEARLGGRLGLDLAYLEGSLSPDSGTAGARDIVDARAMVAYRALPWLTFKAGPHLVGFVAPSGTERWLRWEGRARAEGDLITGSLRTHVETWMALSTSVNVGTGASGARGGEAGLTLWLPRSPLSVRLAYAIDRAELSDNGGTATIEGISLQLRFARR